jgi:hypothetical protein
MDSRIGWDGEPFGAPRRMHGCAGSHVGQALTRAQMIRAARAMAKSLKRKSAYGDKATVFLFFIQQS